MGVEVVDDERQQLRREEAVWGRDIVGKICRSAHHSSCVSATLALLVERSRAVAPSMLIATR